MTPYSFSWACFDCRKSFKKLDAPLPGLLAQPVVLCPQCRAPLEWMGRKFAAPKQSDIAGWNQTREWLRQRQRQHIENGMWQQRAAARLVLSKKERAKLKRKMARAACLKTARRQRYMKNLAEQACQQDENFAS